MKFLVVGGGSMGKRRIRCLLANEVDKNSIRLVETRQDRRDEVKEKLDIECVASLEAGLAWNPDAFIICVPGAMHIDVLLVAAQHGKHAFCEVPLATNLEKADSLLKLATEKSLLIAPGVQTPFHPVWRTVKQWIEDKSFGKPLIYHQLFGEYLPDWHPYEDYRRFYASDQKMGGGNLDIMAQELSVLYWLLPDRVEKLFCHGSLLSSLEIKAFDCQQIMAWTDRGMAMTLQFDLIQRRGINVARIISEQGTIEYTPQYAKRFMAGQKDWEVFEPGAEYKYEQCYIEEIRCFIDALEGRRAWHNPLSTAIDVVRFLVALGVSHSNQAMAKVS